MANTNKPIKPIWIKEVGSILAAIIFLETSYDQNVKNKLQRLRNGHLAAGHKIFYY